MQPVIFILGGPGAYPRYETAIRMAGGTTFSEDCWQHAWKCDALLLPGGGDLEPWRYGQTNTASQNLDPARDQQEWLLVQQFAVLRRPVLGICRGLQTINVCFGGTLLQDLPGHSTVDGIDRLHRVQAAPSFLKTLYGSKMIVNSAHHQAVDRLGAGLEAIQWAPDGTVEALRHTALPVWAVQWHPERLAPGPDGTVDGRWLFRAFLQLVAKK